MMKNVKIRRKNKQRNFLCTTGIKEKHFNIIFHYLNEKELKIFSPIMLNPKDFLKSDI